MSLLMCLLVAYVLVRASEDATSAIRKQPPPREAIRAAKMQARANNGSAAPQSPVGRYVTGLIDDAWDSAHHRRKLMSDERGRRRERRITRRIERRQAREQRRDEKRARTHTEPDQPQPVGFDADAPTPDAAPADPPTGTATGGEATGNAAADGATAGAEPPGPQDIGDGQEGPAELGGGCGPIQMTPPPSNEDEPAEPAGDTPQDAPAGDGADTDPSHETPSGGTPAPSSDNANGNVIPFPTAPPAQSTTNTPTGMELPTMSTEITGLNSAIQYANDLSTYCSHTNDQISSVLPSDTNAVSSCEQARASLESGGVTGQPLADVTAVQEQMTAAVTALNDALSQLEAAGASAESLRQRLTSHLSVQESYSANPDAGSREFVTAD